MGFWDSRNQGFRELEN
jgi:hypothetical protein